MADFFPFIHKIEKKKDWEPEQLYVELYPPPLEKIEEEESDKKDDDRGIIIIQL